MAKYIDANKLIHDLEERIYAYSEGYANGDNYRKDAIETLLKDVKYQLSLQQEQPKVDLEKEIDNFLNETGAPYLWCNDDEQKEWCSIIARYFWNKGYNARNK
jgi:hypothetical protein